jgi:hypothetical protein
MAKSQSHPLKPRARGASRYKRSETSRLLKGAIDAGLTVRGLEVDSVTGALRVLVEPDKDKPKETSPLDNGRQAVVRANIKGVFSRRHAPDILVPP